MSSGPLVVGVEPAEKLKGKMKNSERDRRSIQSWIAGLIKFEIPGLENMRDRIRDDLKKHLQNARADEMEIQRKLKAVEKELERKIAIRNRG